MANRQALREFQLNLAARLQAARSHTSKNENWLAVQAGTRNYLLPLDQAGEIFPWAAALPVPYTAPWFWGVTNLRGCLTGVVDLCALLGHPIERMEQSLHAVCLLLIHPRLQVNTALIIDRLLGLRGATDFASLRELSAEDRSLNGACWMGPCYEDRDGGVWQVLDLHTLVQSPKFLNICI